MADLTVTTTETITLNGRDQGSTTTSTITGINDLFKRTVTVAGTEIVLYTTNTSAVGGSVFDEDLVKYVRITNLDTSNNVDLIIANTGSDEVGLQLKPGKSFILWDHDQHMIALGTAITVTAAAASAGTIVVADGDATGNQPSENDYYELISSSGVTKRYVFIDAQLSTITTGTVLSTGDDSGSSTVSAANNGGIAVAGKMTTSPITQNAWLVQIKAAIEHANGHNGLIVCGSVPGQADGSQNFTVTQSVKGTAGDRTITESVTHADYTHSNFSSGAQGEAASKLSTNSVSAIANTESCKVEIFVAST